MHSDSRKSFRIQTPEHQQRGLFVLGRQRFQVLMLNTSASGFAFLSPQPISVSLGTVARLQADDAWYKVLVVRSDVTEEGVVYGVERLADIASDTDGSAPAWARSRGGEVKSTVPTILAVAGVILCAALSAYLIAGRPTLDAFLRTLTAGASPTHPPRMDVGRAGTSRSLGLVFVHAAPALDQNNVSAPPTESEIASRQRALLSMETAKALRLTAHQQRELEKLLNRPRSVEGEDTAWEELRQNEARILQILTPPQVSQWRIAVQ